MIIYENTLISEDLFEEKFICNLDACKGECCVAGDSGAPLEKEELPVLDKIYPEIKPYLRPESLRAIEKQGLYMRDFDGEWVTPLNDGKECSYTVFDENGVAKCAIELAFLDGKIQWPKPLSCHLYPVRIVKLASHEALNYHRWPICDAACELGKKENVTIHRFLKSGLIRKFGVKWYRGLEKLYAEWNKNRKTIP